MHTDEAYDELCAYTLGLGDEAFIHQHVVDARAAQLADNNTKAITLTFALVGLCLHFEKHFTGHQVQRVHMLMAKRRRSWPRFELPDERGSMSPVDVMSRKPGLDRNRAIDEWAASVWSAFAGSRAPVETLLAEFGF